jgi:hypothetical protein
MSVPPPKICSFLERLGEHSQRSEPGTVLSSISPSSYVVRSELFRGTRNGSVPSVPNPLRNKEWRNSLADKALCLRSPYQSARQELSGSEHLSRRVKNRDLSTPASGDGIGRYHPGPLFPQLLDRERSSKW